jgi:hypothetical protein
VLKYRSEKFPVPKDFAEFLEKLSQKVIIQRGIKAKVSVEMPNGSPEMYRLRKEGVIVDRVFIINLFVK